MELASHLEGPAYQAWNLSLFLSLSFFFAAFSVCLPFAKTKASSFYRFMPYEDWQVGHSALASQGLKTAANICSF